MTRALLSLFARVLVLRVIVFGALIGAGKCEAHEWRPLPNATEPARIVELPNATYPPLPFMPVHDIYTGVVDKAGTLCCGINDCAVTKYKIRPEGIDFFWQDRKWIVVPERMITYAYLKGDDDGNGHLCARAALTGDNPERVFGDMFFYCGFLPPQGF